MGCVTAIGFSSRESARLSRLTEGLWGGLLLRVNSRRVRLGGSLSFDWVARRASGAEWCDALAENAFGDEPAGARDCTVLPTVRALPPNGLGWPYSNASVIGASHQLGLGGASALSPPPEGERSRVPARHDPAPLKAVEAMLTLPFESPASDRASAPSSRPRPASGSGGCTTSGWDGSGCPKRISEICPGEHLSLRPSRTEGGPRGVGGRFAACAPTSS